MYKKLISLLIILAFIIQTTGVSYALKPIASAENPVSLETALGNGDNRSYTYSAGNFSVQISNPNANHLNTSEGVISLGMSMQQRLLYPDTSDYPAIIVAPHDAWVGKDGTNLMQIYFSVACNFFIHKRKTTIVCSKNQKERIVRYLELGNPYEMTNAGNYSPGFMAQLLREAIYLADRAEVDGQMKIVAPEVDMIEFALFSEAGETNVGNVNIHNQNDGTFLINDSGEKGTILDGRSLSELDLNFIGVEPISIIPEFGVTFLGTSSGMDANGLSSNQIIWAGEQHILVDVGVSTLSALAALELSPKYITNVVITHLHEDHVAGLLAYLEWCKINSHTINLMMEPGLYELLKEQLYQVLNANLEDVYDIEFTPLVFYKDVQLGKDDTSIDIEVIPAFHGTPGTMLRFNYKGETISHSSDTTFDPIRFKQILDKELPAHIIADLQTKLSVDGTAVSIFGQERIDELTDALFAQNQSGNFPKLVIYEGGNAAPLGQNASNHTTPFTLQTLSEEFQRKVLVNHTAKLPEGTDVFLRHATPMSTYVVIPGKETSAVLTTASESLFRKNATSVTIQHSA